MSEKCCMFQEERYWKEAVADLEWVESFSSDDRRGFSLYRCKKCGALVLKEYEEQYYYTPDENWDDAYCYDRYYPVESSEEAGALAKEYYSGGLAKKRSHLEISYKELTPDLAYHEWVTV